MTVQTDPNALWPCVAIVGVGMIGGSIGKALLGRRLADRVIGIGRNAGSLDEAKRSCAVSETSLDLAAAVADADLVVVATGVASIPRLLDEIDAAVQPGTLLTDAGSTKASIVAAWEQARPGRRGRFVGAHPIAGSHRRGPAAADADLFAGRVTVVTPGPHTPPIDSEAVAGFWDALGSRVATMSPEEHDAILARTSHAPHLLAAAIATATPAGCRRFTAGGWRDTTRIAAGDPELWADILLDNGPEVVAAVESIQAVSADLLAAIQAADRGHLLSLLTRAKEDRDAVGS
jgi:prephenate dehydrogenase